VYLQDVGHGDNELERDVKRNTMGDHAENFGWMGL
jgi:hypothetical protein